MAEQNAEEAAQDRTGYFRDIITQAEQRIERARLLDKDDDLRKIRERQEYIQRIKQFFSGFEFDNSKIDEVLAKQEQTLQYFLSKRFRKKQMPREMAHLLLTNAFKFAELLILHMQHCRVGLPQLYNLKVKETVYNLLAFDPSLPDDVDQMSKFLADGCKPSYAQRVKEKIDPGARYSQEQLKRVHLQQKLVLEMEEMCFSFLDLITNNGAVYELESSSKKRKCPKAADDAVLKNYRLMLFRQLLQDKHREKAFNDRLGAYISRTQDQIDLYRAGQRRRYKEGIVSDSASCSSCSESHSPCEEYPRDRGDLGAQSPSGGS